jgi:hypothetical protein
MTAQPRATVVDADGHVLEPADTWQKYLEPQLRDRAIHIARDAEGLENLIIDGRPLKNMRGQLGALGGIDMDKESLFARGQVTYAEGCPRGSYDPAERLEVMDAEDSRPASRCRGRARVPPAGRVPAGSEPTGGGCGLRCSTLSASRSTPRSAARTREPRRA